MSLPILVSGGGIGGLACALALVRRGHAVRVFEQSAEFREIGAGIQLGPNVFRMFERLGLTGAVLASAVLPDNLVMLDALTGEEVTRIPVGGEAFRRRYDGYPYAVIHRADLHQVFLDACREEAGIDLRVLARVTGIEGGAGGVTVTLDSGERHEGAALIGADGLWSKTREYVLGDGKPRVSGHVAYRAVLPRAEVPDGLWRNDVVLWAGPKTHLVHYPLRRGELYNLVAVFHSDRYEEGWNTFGDPGELHARFAAARPEVRALLERIDTWKMWVLCDREPVRGWSKGRVTLLGDAAHPMLQYLAQGANMATEDAVVLAGCLESAAGDFEAAFADYEAQRYLRTARVQLTARYYGDVYHAAGVTRELRNLIVGAPRTPEQAIEGMAWLYDGIDLGWPQAPGVVR